MGKEIPLTQSARSKPKARYTHNYSTRKNTRILPGVFFAYIRRANNMLTVLLNADFRFGRQVRGLEPYSMTSCCSRRLPTATIFHKPRTMETKAKEQEPPANDELMDSLYSHIANNWQPAKKGDTNVSYFTTLEFYEMLGTLYPELPIAPGDLATWMYQHGYRYVQAGENKLCWILKQVACQENSQGI